jgi:DNA (cytosine-5)-methyltransferase 3A
MNVLSLFDGMSCGQIALGRAGIKVDKYFASEIKPHAIKLTQHHYPNTIQLGDVTKIKGSDLPKIDMIIGGSPCQDFSLANKERLGLNGMKSRLFFEYKRLLDECKPSYFLLENVNMTAENYRFISECLGVFPVNINSSLVSAAYRDRHYWTNIGPQEEGLFGQKYCVIPKPKDKGIQLKDVLENGYTDTDKARSLNTHDGCAEANTERFWKRYTTTGVVTAVFLSQDLDYKKGLRHFTQTELERLQTCPEGYTKELPKRKAWDLLGDGWTIDVISHIFNFLPEECKK